MKMTEFANILDQDEVAHYEQAWQPCWSCDLDCLNKLFFPQPKEALYKILLQLA